MANFPHSLQCKCGLFLCLFSFLSLETAGLLSIPKTEEAREGFAGQLDHSEGESPICEGNHQNLEIGGNMPGKQVLCEE